MMSEDEACEKWCPMARVVFDQRDTPAWNRDDNVPQLCCASRCMAWRWAPKPMLTRNIYVSTDEHRDLNEARRTAGWTSTFFAYDGATWRYEFNSSDARGEFIQITRAPDEGDRAPTHGYCGAFGKPEPMS